MLRSFTPEIYRFLLLEGYTHILYKGFKEIPKKPSDQEDYVLVPVRRIGHLEKIDERVENIDSIDVKEMLEFTPGIDFWVELTDQEGEKFERINN